MLVVDLECKKIDLEFLRVSLALMSSFFRFLRGFREVGWDSNIGFCPVLTPIFHENRSVSV
jgi:hypothetical protein